MLIENTKENQAIINVAATMAIENMPLSEEFIRKLQKIARGEMTCDQLREELNKKYVKR